MSSVAAPAAVASSPLHRLIPLANIQPSKTNPRKSFDPKKLDELAGNIKLHGILQPILVRPLPGVPVAQDKHEVVAGERRYRAATIAALPEIPCIVRQLNDEETLEIQVIENVQRDDLHPLEEAQGYRDLVKLFRHTPADIAAKVGKSPSYVVQRMSLAKLGPDVQKLYLEDKFNLTVALLLARIPVPKLQTEAAKTITERGGMTPTHARDHVIHYYMLDLKAAPFDPADADLNKTAGACGTCPKRTGNQAALFEDISKGDLCTDPVCFRGKCEEHGRRLVQAAKAKGARIIEGKEAKEVMPWEHGGIQGGFIRLDAKIYDDPKERTARQILGKDHVTVLVVNPHRKGEVIEVVAQSAIKKALKEQGVTKATTASSRPKPSAADRERSLNAKLETTVRRRIFDAVREKLGEQLSIDDWRLIASELWEQAGYSDIKLMADIWAPVAADGKRTDGDRHKAVTGRISKMTAGELGAFMLQTILVQDLEVSMYSSKKAESADPLLQVAKRHDVDIAKIRATVKAELAPEKKPAKKAKKPAAKKKAKAAA